MTMESDNKTDPRENESVEHTQIVKQEQSGLQVFDPEADIQRGQRAAKALLKLVKLTKPLKLGGKDYLYFEHWITIARFFNATVGIESTTKTSTGWEAKAIVYQNGQIIGSAEASCNNDEQNWKNKPDFQRKSMAQTRAASKALRQIFGYIPVLAGIEATPAEELEAPQTLKSAITAPKARPVDMEGAPKAIKPISQKQALFIKSLRTQKGLEQISDDDLRKLTSEDASKEIARLQIIEEVPIINIENHEM